MFPGAGNKDKGDLYEVWLLGFEAKKKSIKFTTPITS
jgi:hypothetical protein